MGQGSGREAGRGASCGTLSERVLSCYLYDRGWQGGSERERVDQIKASKAALFRRGEDGEGKKEGDA